jgi:hypothetical protein
LRCLKGGTSVILHTVGHPDYHVVLVRNHNSRNHLRYRRVGCVLMCNWACYLRRKSTVYFEMIAVPAMSGSGTTGAPVAFENSSTALCTPR